MCEAHRRRRTHFQNSRRLSQLRHGGTSDSGGLAASGRDGHFTEEGAAVAGTFQGAPPWSQEGGVN